MIVAIQATATDINNTHMLYSIKHCMHAAEIFSSCILSMQLTNVLTYEFKNVDTGRIYYIKMQHAD